MIELMQEAIITGASALYLPLQAMSAEFSKKTIYLSTIICPMGDILQSHWLLKLRRPDRSFEWKWLRLDGEKAQEFRWMGHWTYDKAVPGCGFGDTTVNPNGEYFLVVNCHKLEAHHHYISSLETKGIFERTDFPAVRFIDVTDSFAMFNGIVKNLQSFSVSTIPSSGRRWRKLPKAKVNRLHHIKM